MDNLKLQSIPKEFSLSFFTFEKSEKEKRVKNNHK